MPRSAPGLTIGTLAERTGCNPPTIRYYEEIGLLPRPGRRVSGHRSYGEEDLRRLTFIRRCRDFGFPVEQVRALVALTESPDRDCAEARDVAQTHLEAVREKLAELHALEQTLADFVETCTAACAGGPANRCTMLEDLSVPVPAKRAACCG
jgi:MerR family copper efflux transcriptional regulator